MNTKITLTPEMFCDRRYVLVDSGPFKATAFRYSTGVCALEVDNGRCRYILLPFQGQQIWRICFEGRDFTMRSIFEEPQPTDRFDLNYGAFLIHCGLTAMGNPSDEDDHPMHGELPNAAYSETYIEIGEDEQGRFIKTSGVFRYKNALEFNYTFAPSLRLGEGETVIRAEAGIENLRCNPLYFMYMAHINWLPVDGSRLVYSAKKDSGNIEVFRGEFEIEDERNRRLAEFTDRLIADPAIGDVVDSAAQVYDPELCSGMRYCADERGYAHAMQVLPDGRACYVGFETGHMPYALRWIARTGDEDALGFCLPATGNHLGLAYAKEHNLRQELPARSGTVLRYNFGLLSGKDAAETNKLIEALCAANTE